MSNEAKVGSFVIAALIIFIYTFIKVASVQLAGERVPYKTYFEYAGGLDPGTEVRFGGLKSGVVTDVRPGPEDPTRVEVSIEISDTIPVNEDSVAKIGSLSPLSQPYLEITPGSKEARRLEAGETIGSEESLSINDITAQVAEVANTAEVVLKDLQKEFTAISGDTQELLANLQELTGEKNQKSMEQLLENANVMVAEQRPKLDEITDQVSEMLEKIDHLAEDFRTVAESADETIQNVNRTVEETREPIKKDLEQLEVTLTSAREALERIDGLVAMNEHNVSEMIENFRIASQNVEQLTDELRQRPWSLIRVKPKEDRKVPLPASGSQ